MENYFVVKAENLQRSNGNRLFPISSGERSFARCREIRGNPEAGHTDSNLLHRSVVSTEFTRRGPTSRSGYRDPLSARDFKENVGRLVVTVEEYLFRELRVAVLACARPGQVPRTCIGGTYARDAVRYVTLKRSM